MTDDDAFLGIPWWLWLTVLLIVVCAKSCETGESTLFRALEEMGR